MKDGGKESTVTGYWLIECKSLFSIVLLKFEGDSREMYHNHAFNCWNWLLKGRLTESLISCEKRFYKPSLLPFKITKDDFHKVDSTGTSWLISIRGSWDKTWKEFDPKTNNFKTLIEGRIVIEG